MAYARGPVLRVGRVVVGSGPGATSMILHSSKVSLKKPYDLKVLQVGDINAKHFGWQKMPSMQPMGQLRSQLMASNVKPDCLALVGEFNGFESGKLASVGKDLNIPSINGFVSFVKKWATGEIQCVALTPNGVVEIVCEEFIGITGAGSQRELEVPIQHRTSERDRWFQERTNGVKLFTGATPMISGSSMLIVGDGPTALWNAQQCRQAGNSVFVVGPNLDTAFAAANPGGNNSHILNWLRNERRLLRADVEGIEERENMRDFSDPIEPGMLIHLRNMTNVVTGKEVNSFVIPASQLISSIGTRNDVLNYMSPCTSNDLTAITMGGSFENQYGVALANSDRDILIIGAAAVDASADFLARNLFTQAGHRIGQPDKGIMPTRHQAQMAQWIREVKTMGGDIADIASALEHLTRSMEVDSMTANGLQFAQFLNDIGVSRFNIEPMVTEIVKLRDGKLGRGEIFSNLDLFSFINDSKKF